MPDEESTQGAIHAWGVVRVRRSRYGDEVLKVQWRLVIFDEFHTLKNYKAKKYKFAEKLKCKVKIGLTGKHYLCS
jgi:superfamily II DNA or RNA helicase